MTTQILKHSSNLNNQRGVVLLVGLVIVVLITIVALASIKGSGLQEAMAGNMRDRTLSLAASESAVSAAERIIEPDQNSAPPLCGVTGGVCKTFPRNAIQNSASYLSDNDFATNSFPLATQLSTVYSSPPKYIIEQLMEYQPDDGSSKEFQPGGDSSMVTPYLITVKGVGMSDVSQTVVQSTYVRLSN